MKYLLTINVYFKGSARLLVSRTEYTTESPINSFARVKEIEAQVLERSENKHTIDQLTIVGVFKFED